MKNIYFVGKIRKGAGTYVITVPAIYVNEKMLQVGDVVAVEIRGGAK